MARPASETRPETAEKKKPQDRTARKAPKKITATYLHNSGLYYLQRYSYSASAGHFRRVMMRKVDKSCRAHPEQDRAACVELVGALVETFIRSGLLNDEIFAAASVTSLRRRGESGRGIHARLNAKGLPGDAIATALKAAEENDGQDDFRAALRFAQRRRLGPFARGDVTDPEKAHAKALATFGRAGFSYALASQILRMNAVDAAEYI